MDRDSGRVAVGDKEMGVHVVDGDVDGPMGQRYRFADRGQPPGACNLECREEVFVGGREVGGVAGVARHDVEALHRRVPAARLHDRWERRGRSSDKGGHCAVQVVLDEFGTL
jgi:hypothetical protein